jgi:multicomponent Na+:H+ antiporter subunit E
MKSKLKRLLQLSIPLFVVYLMLTGNMALPNLIAGVIVAFGVSKLLPEGELPPFSFGRIYPFFKSGFWYLITVAAEVVRGAVITARIVLSPEMPLKTGIIAIPSGSKSELSTALSAHAITLSPGEMVVAIDDEGVMYTHCLNVDDSEQFVEKAQSLRLNFLSKMFE